MDRSTLLWGILTIALTAFGTSFCVLFFTQKESETDLSLHPRSVEVAGKILSYMDQSADPCNDFWRYSCGGFLDNTILPGDKSRYSNFDVADEKVYVVLKKELENSSNATPDSESIEKAKQFYASCMNEGNFTSESLVSYVQNELNGWPLITGEAWVGTTVEF